jgi:hypothetical protein
MIRKASAVSQMRVIDCGLAGHALGAGLVDQPQMFACLAVGAGKRFFPDPVRFEAVAGQNSFSTATPDYDNLCFV